MPLRLRVVCALHYALGLLSLAWTGFFAWVSWLAVCRLAAWPWSAWNAWDRVCFVLAPMALAAAATAAILNLLAPAWLCRRDHFERLRALAWLNAVPLLSFFSLGLPLALYSLWLFRQDSTRAWWVTGRWPAAAPVNTVPADASSADLPAVADMLPMTSAAVGGVGPVRRRRATTQILAEVAR